MPATSPAPISVTTAVGSPKLQGKPVTIFAEMVFTNRQGRSAPKVPASEYRLTDSAAAIMRHPGSPVYIPEGSPSIKLEGVPGGTLDALIAAARAGGKYGPMDDSYNAAMVAVQGVLSLGKGKHDNALTVAQVGPASWEDLRSVQKR